MEGLPYDFGVEEDGEDDDEDFERKEKPPVTGILESLRENKESDKDDEAPTKEKLLESNEDEPLDNAPELDTEAPLESLSKEETKAVAQTMATERLADIQNADEVELTSETIAAESFLENVEASGDIDQAYHETLLEIGETATKPITPEEARLIETETALPVDPESLLQDAKNELSAGVSYKISRPDELQKSPKSEKPKAESANEKTTTERPRRTHSNVVDYLVGRRFARISTEANEEIIENRLSNEVSHLQLELASKETHVRQLAQNKMIEKKRAPNKKSETETETIGRVLIDSELPERPVGHRNEVAGISAHTMKRAELLKAASAIKVEGNSLKQIYESHLVGEKGLRRVVAEYLRGGNYVKALKHELVEREKDFERDPNLRDKGTNKTTGSLQSQLDQMLHRSGIDWSEPQPTIENPKVKSNNLPALLNDLKSPTNPLRRVLDVVLIGTIITLAIVITVLIFDR